MTIIVAVQPSVGQTKNKSTSRGAHGQVNNCESSYLSDAQPVSDNAVHSVGVHLSPLELEAVDPGPVLPQGAVGVVVELWRVRLTWREAHKNMKSTHTSLLFSDIR